ncbi:MAG: HEAT repeat domain-containing protein [Chloroflexota bacterium]|nr:HEAT repeat domain-containing protein [Chloroflexota bacterium]
MTFSDPSSNVDTEMVNVSSEQAFVDVAPPVGETPPQVLARQAADGRRGAAWRLMYWVVDDDPRAILAISSLDDDRLAAHLLEFIALGSWAEKSFVVPRQIRSAHTRTRLRTLFLPGAGMEMGLAERVLQKGARDHRASVREAALYILGMGAFPGIAPVLIERLEDPVPAVRLQAARALGHAGDMTALPALIKALHGADEQLSGQIFHALVHLGSTAVPALIKESESASPWIRWHCMRALGEICDDRALPVLVRALNDVDHSVAWAGAKSLVHFGKRSIEPTLRLLLLTEASPWMVETASHVLHTLCQRDTRLTPYLDPVIKSMHGVAYRIGTPQAAHKALALLSTDGMLPKH